MSDNTKQSNLCEELSLIEKKRKERTLAQKNAKGAEKIFDAIKKMNTLKLLYMVGVLGVVGMATHYACGKIDEKFELSEQNHVRQMLGKIDKDVKHRICQEYDGELLLLINAYQSGKKLNGVKMSPHNSVFMAHSDLLYKYGAYNPDVRDEKHTMEDWVLFDHMCYRYYQYKEMELSNVRGETENPYLDMLREEILRPAKRIFVRHNNLFEGLKLDNIMKR